MFLFAKVIFVQPVEHLIKICPKVVLEGDEQHALPVYPGAGCYFRFYLTFFQLNDAIPFCKAASSIKVCFQQIVQMQNSNLTICPCSNQVLVKQVNNEQQLVPPRTPGAASAVRYTQREEVGVKKLTGSMTQTKKTC